MRYLEAVLLPNQTVNPLFAMLGVKVISVDEVRAVLHLPFKHELLQGGGVVGGGVLATLLDEAMAHAVLARLEQLDNAARTATIEMNVQYLAAAKAGTDLTATATVVRQGRRVIFTEAEVLSGERPVAKATGSFMVTT